MFNIDQETYELTPQDYLVVDEVNRAEGDCWANCEVTMRAKFFDTNNNWILGSQFLKKYYQIYDYGAT
jgi:hypothetical protein